MRASLRTVLAAVCAVVASWSFSACSAGADVATAVQVLDVSTGWFDVGIVNGQNKLVPSVTFKLKNISDRPVTTLQANVLFHRINSAEEWGSGFLRVAGSEGLAPGATTDPLTVKSDLGYTGSETRADMLKNSQFVDAKVRILAKSGSNYWQPLGEYPIDRRLLTP
jgi:hypothetical protein